ncbi:MAG: acyl carrier protein phosphodiesterase [Saprospiraceae bacterium]
MNYLAHSFLSCQNEYILVGNILGDLLKNRELLQLSENYKKGIKIHRKIDFFTDHHSIHLENLKHLYPSQGKYAPVVIDIYYDYFLGKHWEKFSDISQRIFCDKTYEVLLKHADSVPSKASNIFRRMVEDDFLYSCQTIERLEKTFIMLMKRLSFPSNMENAVQDLIVLESKMEPHFIHFFPEVILEIKRQLDC